MPKYQAVGYLRLSYTKDRENESDSIANQKKSIEEYLKGHQEIELTTERIDDGYSGILFDRPAFQEMMHDIMEGKVNCVIVKDLSRLGREYIETGRYLRRVFPAYGVRFIAVTDGIDTASERIGDDLNISMKNIINDAYCHDISVKTRSALLAKRRNGDYVGACPIYGYQKSEENRNRLVIDEYAAATVREIYRQKIDGVSAKKIAEHLNQQGILPPSLYKVSRGRPHPKHGYADKPNAKWSATTVLRILQNETYTGTLIQGRQGTYNHKIKDVVKRPREEWIRTENAHKPVICRQDFELVQKILGLDTRTTPFGERVYLFSGILICGCCARMTRKTNTYKDRKYIYYHCPAGKKHGCDRPVMILEEALTDCVRESLQAHIRNLVSLEELLDGQAGQGLLAGYEAQIAENEAQLAQARGFQMALYENLTGGLLDKKEYRALKNTYTERIKQLQGTIQKLRAEMEQAQDDPGERLQWMQHLEDFSSMTELDRRTVITLIQSIRIISKTEIKITFRYQMEYEEVFKKLAYCEKASPHPVQNAADSKKEAV